MKKIILSGYMGSGKSTVADILQQKTGIKTLDLDDLIEKKEGTTINEIFKNKGEIAFRRMEHDTLKYTLALEGDFVLSLGGGTPCYANNHELLRGDDMVSVYLKALPETLCERLGSKIENRPLLAGKSPEELLEFIAKHLFERSYYYNQSQYHINTDGKSPETIAVEIIKLLA